jgi:hypothetical protein
MKKSIIFALLIVCIWALIVAGCTNMGSTSAPTQAPTAPTPTPQIVYVTVIVTPTETAALPPTNNQVSVQPTTGQVTWTLNNSTFSSTQTRISGSYSDSGFGTSSLEFWIVGLGNVPVYNVTYTGSSANHETFSYLLTNPTQFDEITYGFWAKQATLGDISEQQILVFKVNASLNNWGWAT